MRVLIVEDETALANVLTRNLRIRGVDVRSAGTVSEAMLSLGEDWPDGLVLDINLPDDSGWELLRRLGPEDRDRLRIVVISAAPISQKRLAEFRPAHAFVKPFPINALVRALSDTAAVAADGAREGEA
jgi:DNA-binding response OmpR family regulator